MTTPANPSLATVRIEQNVSPIYADAGGDGRYLFLVRYWTGQRGVGVVLSINYHDGEAMDWACYIGAAEHEFANYDEILRHVSLWGAKMRERDARALLGAPYGWRGPETEKGYRP